MGKYIRAFFPSALAVALIAVSLFIFILPETEKSLLEKKRELIRETTGIVISLLDTYASQVQTGTLTLSRAQELAKARLREIRYGPGSKDYFWVQGLDYRTVMHPYGLEQEGQDRSRLADVRGKFFIAEAVDEARLKGEGWVSYYWHRRDNPEVEEEKLSYVRLYQPWGWVIGTGVYLDEVRQEIAGMTRMFTYMGFAAVFLVGGLTGAISWRNYQSDRRKRQAEQAFLEAYAKYHAVLQASPNPVVLYDAQGNATYVNPAFSGLFGWQAEEVLGRSIPFVPEEQKAVTLEAIRELYRRGGTVTLETRRTTKSGQILSVLVHAAGIPDESGNIRGLVVNLTDITERLRKERELADSENLFRAIFEQSYHFIGAMTLDGVVTKINATALKFAGVDESEVMGRYFWETPWWTHSPVLQEKLRGAIREAAQGRFVSFEATHPDARGNISHIDFSIKPVTDPDGKVILLVPEGRDITQRKLAEETQRRTHELLRRVMSNMAQGMLVADGQLKVTAFNEAVRGVFSLNGEELRLGSDVADVIRIWAQRTGQGREMLEQALANLGQRQPYYVDLPGYENGKAVRWVQMYHNPLPDGGFVRTFTDVTEQRRSEQALRQSEERFRAIFEQAAEGIVISDLDGGFRLANQRLCDFLGYTRQELMHLGVKDVSLPDELEIDLPQLKRLVTGETRRYSRVKRYLRKDGSLAWGRISVALVRDAAGRPDYFVAVMEDMAQLMQAEEDKAKLESQLRQSQKMEAVGTLAGGIAHDFNNLLNVILGFAELAQDHARQAKSNDRDILQIVDAATRASQLVQQILTFSRRGRANMNPLDLNSAVTRLVGILERTLPKMIDIEIKPAPDLRPVNCDANQMELVLLNLANNAVDAMGDHGRLVIETQNMDLDADFCGRNPGLNPGAHVLLMVSDNGQGMDEETSQHVFEPFFTTKEIGKGTGLGLSTVYGVVKDHGGHIICYSELGRGTTMKIYLPAHRGQCQAAGSEDVIPREQLRGHETILVTDDEPGLREMAKVALEEMGYHVLTAESGEEAQDVFRRMAGEVRLVVMDLGMPGMGGHRAMEGILALDPGAKVIIASGYSPEGQVKASLEAGAAAFVAKPFRLTELLTTVRAVLDGQ